MTPSGRSYSQLVKRRFAVERVPRGERPVWDIHLEPHERVVGVAYEYQHDSKRRKTVDHVVWLWVMVDLS